MKKIFSLSFMREAAFVRSNTGQMLAIFAITWIIFAGGMFSVYNVGTLVGERMKLQNAADSAAYTGAVWAARSLNYIAYTNRTIIAELSFLAYLCALCSCVDAWKQICGYAKEIPYVGAIFAAIEAILTVIEEILDVIIELPWEELPIAIGMLQTAMEALITLKMPEAMDDVAQGMDPAMSIDYACHAVNSANYFTGMRKEGKWEGLLKVLKETIHDYTKGTFNGALPIYNRSFEISIPIIVVKIVVGIIGDYEITKDKIRTTDGPGLRLYYWDFTDWEWDLAESISWGMAEKEKNIDLEGIRHYVFEHKNNLSCGIYAAVGKSYGDLPDIIFRKLNGYFGADSQDFKVIAKACARYDDPVRSSDRHNTLKGGDDDNDLGSSDTEEKDNDWEPNLFNPFWRAELVSVNAKQSEDYSETASDIYIKTVVGILSDYTLKKH